MGRSTVPILLLVVAVLMGAVSTGSAASSDTDSNVSSSPGIYAGSGTDFVEIARKVTPFVVTISTKRTIEHPPIEQAPSFKGPFERFFRRFREEERFEAEGLGSGVIIREDGVILTNNHVVEEADEIQVSIFENQIYTAEILGRDPTTDLAVIKIDGDGLPVAPLGNSDEAQVGEWVLAIGNPMQLPFTVTAGIISAKGRNIDIIPGSYSIESFIQTDAAINPGNSGGPLINLRGEVVGINTAISSNTGYYQGYGFAIPVNLAKRVLNDIIEEGHVVRGILGISIRNVTPELAEQISLGTTSGIRVEGFVPQDSPARRAGLEQGDVIVGVDGIAVSRVNELQTLVANRKPGDPVTIDIIRDQETMTYTVILIERPEGNQNVASTAVELENHPFGVRLTDLDERTRTVHGLGEASGVTVVEVDPDGPAAAANPFPLQAGDVILEINNGTDVATISDMEEKLDGLRNSAELLLYISRYRDGRVSANYTVIEPRW